MALTAPTDPAAYPSVPPSLSPATALRIAWVSYLVLMLAPFFLFLYVVWSLMHESKPAETSLNNDWFLGTMGYMLVALPATFFYRSHIFKAYWRGDVVNPMSYLTGMLVMWLAFEAGGIISLIGCLVTRQLMPCLIPAAVAFVFFTFLWPSGRAMTRHVGSTDDPSTYEEPR